MHEKLSSKHQHPTSREAPNFKLQSRGPPALELEVSLELGCWCLELFKFGALKSAWRFYIGIRKGKTACATSSKNFPSPAANSAPGCFSKTPAWSMSSAVKSTRRTLRSKTGASLVLAIMRRSGSLI